MLRAVGIEVFLTFFLNCQKIALKYMFSFNLVKKIAFAIILKIFFFKNLKKGVCMGGGSGGFPLTQTFWRRCADPYMFSNVQ